MQLALELCNGYGLADTPIHNDGLDLDDDKEEDDHGEGNYL